MRDIGHNFWTIFGELLVIPGEGGQLHEFLDRKKVVVQNYLREEKLQMTNIVD